MPDDTTTIEVSHEVWAGLDKRKERGESFDDVIRRAFAQTPAPIGTIQEAEQDITVASTTELDNPPAGATCVEYDVIAGETCGESAKYLAEVQYGDGDPQELYYCAEHGSESE